MVGEDGRVGGMDELVDFRRGLFDDQGPEVRDAGDGGGAVGVGLLAEGVLFAH